MLSRPLMLAFGTLVSSLISLSSLAAAGPDESRILSAATRLQLQGHWSASESLVTPALERLQRDPAVDSLQLADALYLFGSAWWNVHGYADSTGLKAAIRGLGIRSRHLPPNDINLAESHADLGTLYYGTGNSDSATLHVRRAIAIRLAQPVPNDTTLADSWDQLALILRNRLDFHAALDAWGQSIACLRRVYSGDHPDIAMMMAETGICWMELRDLDQARSVLRRSLDIFARMAPDDSRRRIPIANLAAVERRAGNLGLGIDLYREQIRVSDEGKEPNNRSATAGRGNLASCLLELGDYPGALPILREFVPMTASQVGLNHWRTLGGKQSLAIATAACGDTAAAMRLLREVEARFAAMPGPPHRWKSIGERWQANLLFQQRRFAEALAMSRQALRTEEAVPQPSAPNLANIYYILIPVLEALRDTAGLDSAARELPRMDQTYGPGSQVAHDAFVYCDARAARALGRREQAWTRALEAEQLSRQRVLQNLKALPDNPALQFTRQESHYLELVLDLAGRGSQERQEAAWDRIVRSRGMVRAECARRRPPPEFASDTAVVVAHERWVDAERQLAQLLVSSSEAPRDSAVDAAVERLRAAADAAEAGYVSALETRGARRPALDVGLADVRARLGPGVALVSFFESRGSLPETAPFDAARDSGSVLAFVTRGGKSPIQRVDLGRSAALRSALEAWHAVLAASPASGVHGGAAAERACRRLGDRVRQLTWDRVAPYLARVTDVYMVPDGPLHGLAWQALPEGTKAYFVESGPCIHLLDSERELLDARPASASGLLLAVGGADFDHTRPEGVPAAPQVAALIRSAHAPCGDSGPIRFGSLPGSGAEALAVASEWRRDPRHQATVLSGEEASELSFKLAARGNEVIHIATHGVVEGDTCMDLASGSRGVGGIAPLVPASSPAPPVRPGPLAPPRAARLASPWLGRHVWLALAGANHAAEHHSDENEGLLTAEEVLTLDLQGTDWVVLSACHSGLAEEWSREGTLGMSRAFQVAGARTVIASRWAVEDAATAGWMQQLYAARARGLTTGAAAVQAASRAILHTRRVSGRSTHPFYWAGFDATGE